jgi:hypothetical protein
MKRVLLSMAVLLSALACSLPSESGKAITSFSIMVPEVTGAVNEEAKTIGVVVPSGTAVSSLVARFAMTGVSVSVGGVTQESGCSVNDFTGPVSYVVSAEDGSTAAYVVTVSIAPPLCGDKSITAFAILQPSAVGEIDEPSRSVVIAVPHGTDVSSLVAVYTITGVALTVDDTEQTSGVSINDFSEPRQYVVRAEDGSTTCYTVTVTVLPGADKAITSFSILNPRALGVIDQEGRIIRVRVPPGTGLTALVAEFATGGARVTVNDQEQTTGVTMNDFSGPIDYVVHAEDGTTARYAVRVVAGIGLVINELDADQVGTDMAEYIELYASADVDLFGIALALVNGGVTPGQEYARIDLSSMGCVPMGSYLVIAGPNVSVPLPARKLTPTGWELSNRVQNGPNDAVILFDTLGKRIVDTVTYNGTLHRAVLSGETGEWDATEGTAGAPADSNTVAGSLSRLPNAGDSGQNNVDFKLSSVLTPGTQNMQ